MTGIFIAGAVTGVVCFIFGFAICAMIKEADDGDD